jgi:hypothetical protein
MLASVIPKLMPFGPVFFGVFIFAPMWAAAMAALSLELPFGAPNIALTLIVGLCWGWYAKQRGSWL